MPLLEAQFRTRKRPVGSDWRLDETYVRVKGIWKYRYRAVDKPKPGATVDFLLTTKRDCKAALRFLCKAITYNGTPEKITIDKSGGNTAAIGSYNTDHKAGIEKRQIKYLKILLVLRCLEWVVTSSSGQFQVELAGEQIDDGLEVAA